MENARWQMALETELARTVSSLQSVRAARVHLALPRPSAFAQTRAAASASVLIEVQSGRTLEPGQVEAIRHMVASSVPELAASAVTVIDQFGRLLSPDSADPEFAQSAEQYQYARRAEADYVRRIEQLLTPMLGPDHVSAQVAADFDFAVTEEAHESYKPDGAVVRSEQLSEDSTHGAAGAAQGIPGATSNQPATAPPTPASPALPGAAATPADATTSRTQTRNYELDRTLSHTRQSPGRLRRLSVAVLVDNLEHSDDKGVKTPAPLTPEQLAKVEALVKQAVGFDTTRGDSVTVQNAPFLAGTVEAPPPLPLWQRPDLRDWARQGSGALLVLVLILAVLRPLLRSLMARPRAETAEGVAAAAAAAGAIESEALAGPPPYELKLAQARAAVAQDPKRVAQVMKTWLADEGS
jgi:flagellar M-ring protein FliF